MTLSITFETDKALDFDAAKLLDLVAEEVRRSEACPFACQVEVLLLKNEAIRDINLSERGIDSPTDVLSFPAVNFSAPGDFSGLEEDPLLFEPDSGELLLGDIVISLEKVLSQAEEYGHSPRRELAFLMAHSLLHLFGYDHEEDGDRQIMEEKQEAVLQRLGILRK